MFFFLAQLPRCSSFRASARREAALIEGLRFFTQIPRKGFPRRISVLLFLLLFAFYAHAELPQNVSKLWPEVECCTRAAVSLLM